MTKQKNGRAINKKNTSKQKTPPIVLFETFHVSENAYVTSKKKWKAETLIKACKDNKLESFDLPLAGINIGIMPWNLNCIDGFVYHMKRVIAADDDYPVILDDLGFICDGWHRVVKALVNGLRTIKAYRIQVMPDPDEIIGDDK